MAGGSDVNSCDQHRSDGWGGLGPDYAGGAGERPLRRDEGSVTFTPFLADGTTSQTKAKIADTATGRHENSLASGDGFKMMSAKTTGKVTIRNQDSDCFNKAEPQNPKPMGPSPSKDKVGPGDKP